MILLLERMCDNDYNMQKNPPSPLYLVRGVNIE